MTDYSSNYEYKFYDWKYLDEASLQHLESCSSDIDVKSILQSKLNLNVYEDPMQFDIITDFYFHIYIFCRENAFSLRKISSLISIVYETFNRDASSVAWSNTHAESFAFFNNLLMKHCVDMSPKFIKVFTESDARLIHKFILELYYQNFRLYKYIFSKHLRMKIATKDPQGVESPRNLTTSLQNSIPI
jgi:hypothetical protein